MNELDYVRDNRLRLWFLLGALPAQTDYRKRDRREEFATMMESVFGRIGGRMAKSSVVALVVGDSRRGSKAIDAADLVLEVFHRVDQLRRFKIVEFIEDEIPDIRRSRRDLRGTKRETIIVFRKR